MNSPIIVDTPNSHYVPFPILSSFHVISERGRCSASQLAMTQRALEIRSRSKRLYSRTTFKPIVASSVKRLRDIKSATSESESSRVWSNRDEAFLDKLKGSFAMLYVATTRSDVSINRSYIPSLKYRQKKKDKKKRTIQIHRGYL